MKVEATLCFISGHVASVTIGYMRLIRPSPWGGGHHRVEARLGPRRRQRAQRASGVRGVVPREIWSARAPDTMALLAIGRVGRPQPLYWLLDAWPSGALSVFARFSDICSVRPAHSPLAGARHTYLTRGRR